MKKTIYFLVVLFGLCTQLFAVGYVYQSSSSVMAAQFSLADFHPPYLLLPQKNGEPFSEEVLVGFDDGSLYQAHIAKVDFELSVGTYRNKELVTNSQLQETHKKNVASFKKLIPSDEESTFPSEVLNNSHEPFIVKINHQNVGANPIKLSKKRMEAEILMEFVWLSTTSVWKFDMQLTSSPKLSFWKKQSSKTLNDVPRPKFSYSAQAMLSPYKNGDTIKIPLEIHFIREKSYEWTFKFKNKLGEWEKKVFVEFE